MMEIVDVQCGAGPLACAGRPRPAERADLGVGGGPGVRPTFTLPEARR